ncbi:LIM domain-containing protein PLIM2b [Manihot esculenta]|uniref:LIM zinc-binding domain-containing protein n=2 Tax=Manihot esculenta TaxID=3983 RepID=A0A2C9WA92_MANES|nr:LIM domain-containing protein PLIM2b [Manihot esculenta]OAY56528.1 hypothetical protein MANES_02G024100v8 [Manihot esculenta]
MVFSGTTEKCKACDKTVHFIDMITADAISYHKTCFKCSHCNGLLVMSSYSSMDGVLYCKPHFDQLFRETGSYSKKFPSSGDKKNALARAPSKVSSMFSGTQDKCVRCNKTAYPLEKVNVEGQSYHKTCFRCAHGGCYLTPSSYAALDGTLYCKTHFAQLFKEKGCYNNLGKSGSMRKNEANAPEEPEAEESKTEVVTEPDTQVEIETNSDAAPVQV